MSGGLRSWGRFPNVPQRPHSCSWRDEVAAELHKVVSAQGDTLAFGNGRSYGDSCLAASDHVLHMRTLNRFIEVDWEQGVVRAEAGVTLAEVLSLAVPEGWFLSVTPGTQFATLGGAIANDVHGKNHHLRGTFGNHVLRFGLLRHGEELLTCSPSENSELYAATIGGLGLTGVIVWAEIRLIPIRSSQIDCAELRFGNLAEFFALSAELDRHHEYSVAWIDCVAKGGQSGRGVFFVGDHARYGSLQVHERPKLRVPVIPPVSMVNKLSLRVFNDVYWRAHSPRRAHKRVSYEPFFYPLDRILHWNRIYGRKGFQQYQCVIPDAMAETATAELLRAISDSGKGSFLAVLKRCGDIASPGLLSFPLPGTSLALDFPQTSDLKQLFAHLDVIVRQAGGRLYPAKDAHMSGSDFRNAYPEWERVEALRDPTLMSRLWKRVTE
ncbi:FAD-binding oxidoreductase [Aromatoleum evansii]|uniref:FAD-binding oxidoreductase n=1 Tax=Aromatoleum evansii TaxID=59406 RepID=A0ABZ1AIJ6_AROEV|nr:FAD-binding oxidoreductase [Aromatoleum evansii]